MQAAATSNLKAVCLELGGKSPLIVFNDADLESAADCAITSITFSMLGDISWLCHPSRSITDIAQTRVRSALLPLDYMSNQKWKQLLSRCW